MRPRLLSAGSGTSPLSRPSARPPPSGSGPSETVDRSSARYPFFLTPHEHRGKKCPLFLVCVGVGVGPVLTGRTLRLFHLPHEEAVMRRFLTVVASVFVILVLLAPYADAQQTTAAGPSPKVTINGVIDNVTSWSRNMSLADVNLTRVDKEWYARTRARPDITGELGTTKFVLGLELDYTWGSTCPNGQDVNVRCSNEAGFGVPS